MSKCVGCSCCLTPSPETARIREQLAEYQTRCQVWADQKLARDKYVHELESKLDYANDRIQTLELANASLGREISPDTHESEDQFIKRFVKEQGPLAKAVKRYRKALEWIASDAYKTVPSHWVNEATAQRECAQLALSEKDSHEK